MIGWLRDAWAAAAAETATRVLPSVLLGAVGGTDGRFQHLFVAAHLLDTPKVAVSVAAVYCSAKHAGRSPDALRVYGPSTEGAKAIPIA